MKFGESLLKANNVRYEFVEELPISQINQKASFGNQSRLTEKKNDEWIEYYIRQVQDGSEIPPIIVYQNDRGEYVVMDGNHRVHVAMKMKREFISAFVVLERDEAIIDKITYTANAQLNGQGANLADPYVNALKIVNRGVPIVDVAREYGLSYSKLQTTHRAAIVTETLTEIGRNLNRKKSKKSGDKRDDLIYNDSMLDALHSVHYLPVMRALTDIIDRIELTASDIKKILPDLNSKTSEQEQLNFIAEYAEHPAIKAKLDAVSSKKDGRFKKPTKAKHYVRLFYLMKELTRIVESRKTLTDLDITDPEMAEKAKVEAQVLLSHLQRLF